MSPAGTVNPLEIMDVQCLVSESSANSVGKDACNLFFREIMAEYQKTEAPGLD